MEYVRLNNGLQMPAEGAKAERVRDARRRVRVGRVRA